MLILDGRKIAKEKTIELKETIDKLDDKPSLGIFQVGDLFESNKYITNKINKAKEIGLETNWIKLDENISQENLKLEIKKRINEFDGLIVQLPLPSHINSQEILNCIPVEKDIDGLSEKNMENFYNEKDSYFCPATARAVHLLLESYNIDLNKNILVIGESNLVGKPTKKILSKFAKRIESRNINSGIKNSENFDILVVATGTPHLIKKENVKKGAVIVDVGINTLDNKQVIGDVDFDDVKDKIYAISPVPGGIGPLTVICLLMNLIESFIKKRCKI